jgi:hypothetical protein
MFKNKYITARVNRRTYLKGSFKGKFVGRLDLSKSDPISERFYDIEILEGEIETRQDHLVPWMEDKEPVEFAAAPVFSTRLPGKVNVALHYLNGEVKHFKVALKQIRLMDCYLSDQVYGRNEVYGTMRGLIVGYVLHHDMLVKEVVENLAEGQMEEMGTVAASGEKKESLKTSGNRVFAPVKSPPLRQGYFFQALGLLIGLGLLTATLFIVKNWIINLLISLSIGWLIRWWRSWKGKQKDIQKASAMSADAKNT